MGTRGTCGFRVNGKDLLTYNHFDSYPAGLGSKVAEFIQSHVNAQPGHTLRNFEAMKSLAERLEAIDTDTPPTPAQIAQCREAGTVDLGVSEQKESDWYCLLRNAQGDLGAYLKLGMIPVSNEFIKDSLFCEWGYVVNCDTMKLEVWRGFQHEPTPGNRYGEQPGERGASSGSAYYPCKLVAEIPFIEATPAAVQALAERK